MRARPSPGGASPPSRIALLAAAWLAAACGKSAFAVPAELPEHAPRYSLVVDYQSVAPEAPQRRVALTPLAEPGAGPASACHPSFRVTGKLDALPAAPPTEERGQWVARREQHFDYRVAGPAASLELAGRLERTTTRRADERSRRAGPVSVEDGPVAYQEGHGTLRRGGQPVGEATLQGSTLRVDWEGTRYVTVPRGHGGHDVRRDDALAVYAALDWGHWGVGERAFHIAVDPSLACDELERALSVLLLAQLFAAE